MHLYATKLRAGGNIITSIENPEGGGAHPLHTPPPPTGRTPDNRPPDNSPPHKLPGFQPAVEIDYHRGGNYSHHGGNYYQRDGNHYHRGGNHYHCGGNSVKKIRMSYMGHRMRNTRAKYHQAVKLYTQAMNLICAGLRLPTQLARTIAEIYGKK